MNTLLNYPGAKWGMAEQIISLMPRHRSYLEPFFGSGAVLFNKPGCPMQDLNHCDLHDPKLDIEKSVEAAEKWGGEHPEKTMDEDFFEKFPKTATKRRPSYDDAGRSDTTAAITARPLPIDGTRRIRGRHMGAG